MYDKNIFFTREKNMFYIFKNWYKQKLKMDTINIIINEIKRTFVDSIFGDASFIK